MEETVCTEKNLTAQPENYRINYKKLMISIEKQDYDGINEALNYAKRCLDYDRIQLWINRVDTETGHLPLTLAVETGNPKTIQLLIESGAMPELLNNNRVSALELASIKLLGNFDEGSIILELLNAGSSIIQPSHEQKQSLDLVSNLSDKLMHAIHNQDLHEAKLLLQQNKYYATTIANHYNTSFRSLPLALAIQHQNLQMVKLLLDAEAKPELLGKEYSNESEKFAFKKQSPINKILLGSMQQELRNNETKGLNHTPLTLAVKKQQVTLVQELLRRGANPLLPNKKGKTALDIAIHKHETLGIINSTVIWEAIHQHCFEFFA